MYCSIKIVKSTEIVVSLLYQASKYFGHPYFRTLVNKFIVRREPTEQLKGILLFVFSINVRGGIKNK
jgi:hypothetical protein